MTQLRGFLSYSRQNDSRGAITTLRRQLELTLADLTGENVHIFQDVEGILTGDAWEEEIGKALEQAQFFVCTISQSFVKSDMCRAEFQRALTLSLPVFPVYWCKSRFFDDLRRVQASDPKKRENIVETVTALRQHQYKDVRSLYVKSPEDEAYKTFIYDLAQAIETRLDPG